MSACVGGGLNTRGLKQVVEGTILDIPDNLRHLGHLVHRVPKSTDLNQDLPGKTGLFEPIVESMRRQTRANYSQHRLPIFFVFCCFVRKSLVHIQREQRTCLISWPL